MWETFNYGDVNPFAVLSAYTATDNSNNFNYQEFLSNLKIPVKFKNVSNNPDPSYSHEGDSGFDLRAHLPLEEGVSSRTLHIPPMGRMLIPTGLYFELPESYELQIRSRSGLAVKHGIGVLTGTVDNKYRGEIHVLLINFGDKTFSVENGDRIAQGVLAQRLSTEFARLEKVDMINETVRGDAGFGSTGNK